MPATVWKGYLTFGLVSFPVRLFSAARPETIHFHMLHKKDLSRIKEVWYCAEENKPVDRSDIVKGYEASKGEYVVVEDDELKKIAPPTASAMDIMQFVSREDVDPIFFEASYYVAPEQAVGKPYALFMAALQATKRDAIAKIAMHNREHIVLIRPSEGALVLHTLYYPDELHRANKAESPKAKYSSKELEMAKNLVDHLTAPFKPGEFHDTYRQNVEKLIEQKQKGQKVTPVKQPKKAPVVDIMEALKRSLQTVSPVGGAPAKHTRSRTGGKKRKAA
jgi:DNA end-binding protein Ku